MLPYGNYLFNCCEFGKTVADKAAPLDGFAEFAALAAAISLAYAGLRSFRYQRRVREHALHQVQKNDLETHVRTNAMLLGTDNWCTIYRLGEFNNRPEIPEPIVEEGENQPDHHFTRSIAYLAYKFFYSNNFDKVAAYLFGAMASAFIWFSTYDSVYFFEKDVGYPARLAFLIRVEAFYWIVFAFVCLYLFCHLTCQPAEEKRLFPRAHSGRARAAEVDGGNGEQATRAEKSKRLRERFLGFLNVALPPAFMVFLLSATQGWNFTAPLFDYFQRGSELDVFTVATLVLWLGILGPILLLILGEMVTISMITEINDCIRELVRTYAKQPARASINDRAGPTQPGRPEESKEG